jgi:hypothetical protein
VPLRLLQVTVLTFLALATSAMLLATLAPIAWLFSVSSRSLTFVVWAHVLAWLVAILFAVRFLSPFMYEGGGGRVLALWTILFAMVSFQVATRLRPLLWREPGAPLVESGKRFFLEQLGEAARHDEAAEKRVTSSSR